MTKPTAKPFRVPPAYILRIQVKLDALAIAADPAAALGALFLLHCATKKVLEVIPERENEEEKKNLT